MLLEKKLIWVQVRPLPPPVFQDSVVGYDVVFVTCTWEA